MLYENYCPRCLCFAKLRAWLFFSSLACSVVEVNGFDCGPLVSNGLIVLAQPFYHTGCCRLTAEVRTARYCDQPVCGSACLFVSLLSVCWHVSRTTRPHFAKCSVHVSCVTIARSSSDGNAILLPVL